VRYFGLAQKGISYIFRTGYEVDFILGEGEVALEVKGQSSVDNRDLRPLKAFIEEYATKKALVVCNEKEERVVGTIRVMPWRRFLEELWAGRIIS
jgi:predicted AAA+ superfamily ATPase